MLRTRRFPSLPKMGGGVKFYEVSRNIPTSGRRFKEEVERQKNNPFAKVWGKEANDFEAFLELEKIRERRAEIESYMRLYSLHQAQLLSVG